MSYSFFGEKATKNNIRNILSKHLREISQENQTLRKEAAHKINYLNLVEPTLRALPYFPYILG